MKYGRARLIAYSHSRRTYGESIEFDDQKSWNTSASSINRSNASSQSAPECSRAMSRRYSSPSEAARSSNWRTTSTSRWE